MNKIFKYLLILILGVIAIKQGKSQSFQNTSFILAENLYNKGEWPHTSVQSSLIDQYGILWAGTYNGLVIYDGIKVHKASVPYDTINFWSNIIECMYEDNSGNVWFGSKIGNLFRYNRKQNQWRIYPGIERKKAIQTILIEKKTGHLILGTETGNVIRLNPESGKIDRLLYAPRSISSISISKDDEILVAGDYIYEIVGNEITRKSARKDPKITYRVCGKNYLISNSDSLYFYHLNGILNNQYSIQELFGKKEGLLIGNNLKGWWMYNNGLMLEMTPNGRILKYFRVKFEPGFGTPDFIKIIPSENGIVLILSNLGIFKLNTATASFSVFNSENPNQYLPFDYIRSIFFDNENNAWISSKNSDVIKINLDGKNQKIEYYETNGNTINGFIQLPSKRVIGMGIYGLYRFENGRAKLYDLFSTDFEMDQLAEVWSGEIYDGKFYAGTHKNSIWEIGLEAFEKSSLIGEINPIFKQNPVWAIYNDKENNRLWIGTGSGLYYKNKNSWTKWDHPNFGSPAIWHILANKNGEGFYIGTTNQGLYLIDPYKNIVNKIGSDRGLTEMSVSGIGFDKEGTFWVATSNGLFARPKNSEYFRLYKRENGLPTLDFNFKGMGISKNQQVFFSTKFGLVTPSEKVDFIETEPPSPIIRSVKIQEIEIFSDPFSVSDFEVPYFNNYITFDFINPAWHTVFTGAFRYRLNGLDTSWIRSDIRDGKASFAGLNAGKYELEVQFSANEKIWSKPTLLKFKIVPAFWQTWWFKVAIFIACIILIIFIFRFTFFSKILQERERARVYYEKSELELRALQAQMNPHFLFNALQSIQNYILKNDSRQSIYYLSQFSKLMRLILEASRKKWTTLKEEVELIGIYISLENLRFDLKFEYILELDEKLMDRNPLIPSILLQPFIENAIHHGLKPMDIPGKLTIRMYEINSDLMRIEIEDNGVGRSSKEPDSPKIYKSRALEIINDRTRAYAKSGEQNIKIEMVDLKDQLGRPTGTRIEVSLNHKRNPL